MQQLREREHEEAAVAEAVPPIPPSTCLVARIAADGTSSGYAVLVIARFNSV